MLRTPTFIRVGRLLSSKSRVTATGSEIVSPIIGLADDQAEYYNLARQFADNEMRPHASKKINSFWHIFYTMSYVSLFNFLIFTIIPD